MTLNRMRQKAWQRIFECPEDIPIGEFVYGYENYLRWLKDDHREKWTPQENLRLQIAEIASDLVRIHF